MALIVEDGTGLTQADAYFSVAIFRSVVASYGLDRQAILGGADPDWFTNAPDDKLEVSVRYGTQYVDLAVGDNWVGHRTNPEQALAWPRTGAYYSYSVGAGATPIMYSAGPASSYYTGRRSYSYMGVEAFIGSGLLGNMDVIPRSTIPNRVVRAAVMAAIRDLVTPGSLMPDVAGGRDVISESVGPLSVSYASNRPDVAASSLAPKFPEIEALLRCLMKDGGSGVKFTSRA